MSFQPELYHQYLLEDEWENIGHQITLNNEIPFPLQYASQCWRFLDQGDVKRAVIEGITSLELTINHIIHEGLDNLEIGFEKIDDFTKNVKLQTKLMIVSGLKNNVTKKELDDALEIYSIRNKLVHEGKEPPQNIEPKILNLINLISKLLFDFTSKFPSLNHPNAIVDEKMWEKVTQEYFENNT